MLADGMQTDAVADKLGLSTETVRTHTKRILAKLEASTHAGRGDRDSPWAYRVVASRQDFASSATSVPSVASGCRRARVRRRRRSRWTGGSSPPSRAAVSTCGRSGAATRPRSASSSLSSPLFSAQAPARSLNARAAPALAGGEVAISSGGGARSVAQPCLGQLPRRAAGATPRSWGKGGTAVSADNASKRREWRPVADLLPIADARELVLAAVQPPPAEEVALEEALGRVLAEDVRSTLDVPPFDCSAMDGYALAADGAGELRVVGESRAGHPAREKVEPGTAIRISTGAAMPEGADAVVPVERVETGAGTVRVPETSVGDNVRRAGEDVRRDDLVLRRHHAGPGRGRSARLARARTGAVRRAAAGRPAGDGRRAGRAGRGARRRAHLQLECLRAGGQVDAAGGALLRRETVPDDARQTRDALERALAEADVVCVSGGVSVGPHDHVKGALAELGVEERFWGVRLKPGKPTWFGVRGRTLVFGLPGNPVSAMVTFHLFARPALRRLQRADPGPSLRGGARRADRPKSAPRPGRARPPRRDPCPPDRRAGIARPDVDAGCRRPRADPRG